MRNDVTSLRFCEALNLPILSPTDPDIVGLGLIKAISARNRAESLP
jgi:hypothetical protein